MTRYKTPHTKKVLANRNAQTKWAPVWAVLRAFGKRQVHPYRITHVKRTWKRTKIKL